MKTVCTDCRYPVGDLKHCPYCSCTEQHIVCEDCASILSFTPEYNVPFCTNCAFVKVGEGNG